jgi:hypothetical protein
MWFPEFRSMLDDLTDIIMVDYIQVAVQMGYIWTTGNMFFFSIPQR